MSTTSRWPCSTRLPTSRRTAPAPRLRDAPRTSGITQKLHEKLHPSWTRTKARTRSSRASAWTQPIAPTSPATNAAVSSLRRETTATFSGRPANARSRLARTAGHVHAPMRARRPPSGLPRLAHGLVRHAAGVDDGDLGSAALLVAVSEQRLADRVRVRVRDLAAEKANGERRHRDADATRA